MTELQDSSDGATVAGHSLFLDAEVGAIDRNAAGKLIASKTYIDLNATIIPSIKLAELVTAGDY